MLGRISAAAGFLALLLAAGPAPSAPTECPQHFAGAQAPDLIREALAAKTTAICYGGYALLYSGVSHTPLWTAEHLTVERIADARGDQRRNTFHPDPNLPPEARAELVDYKGSGFDRGHMAPSGDMATPEDQNESFSLANMIPQNPRANQGRWAEIESATRDYAVRNGDVYVVTGPIYQPGGTFQRVGGRVIVPTHTYKALYDPKTGGAGAYIMENASTKDYEEVSIAELERRIGISVFPGLPAAAKEAAMPLPKPHQRK